jgi:hypothetical protein
MFIEKKGLCVLKLRVSIMALSFTNLLNSHSAPRAVSSHLAPNAAGQLHVLRHDGATLGMDGAQLRILIHPNQVGLGGFLKGQDGSGLNPHVHCAVPKGLHDLSDQPLKGKLANEKIWGLLVLADLSQGDCARPVAVLSNVARGRGKLSGSLG